ncbi:MAG: AbrB/MazE/SpoVT family DNA-binding domain-containing protein [Candidatus Marinimicrobia bacterium]|nr:AbrB/MazE/SpoVT family DNA-binding domain-containing protein [Candidatus Neomarinimicrobiota bacterium]MCH8069389.1 AbrB/MazE/SpoVT family DNA-binding domain-containing protein [Candidatus Neomarinimicrobiota bacterium]
MLRKLGKSNQVAIPKNIMETLHLRVDDYLDVYIEDNRIILEPKVVIPKDQAYFFTEEWQREEQQAEKDIQEQRVTKTTNLDELFEEMDK